VTLVDVWATWCGPCKKSFPKLQDLNNKYKPLGLQIIAVSQDESSNVGQIPAFMDATGAKFDVCWDDDNAIANAFTSAGAAKADSGMPFSYVLDKKGVVRFSHTGYRDGEEEQVEKEIKQLLDEK
jgi:cytochrome c biogenesis protein CcmG/thiol:disulfide interchange protein DsbE